MAFYFNTNSIMPTTGGGEINNQDKTVTPTTNGQTVTADQGYTGLGTVTVNPIQYTTRTINPSTSSQTFYAISEKLYTGFDKLGNPIVDNDGIVTGLTPYDYLRVPQAFMPGNDTWEIILKIKTPAYSNLLCYIMGSGPSYFYTVGGELSSNNHLGFGITSNGSSWDIGWMVSENTVNPNTWYWVKLSFDGTQYKLELSTDGENYNLEASVESSTPIYQNQYLSFLNLGTQGTGYAYWTGDIDLNECQIKIDNQIWWKPSYTMVGDGSLGYSQVTVNPVTSSIDANITAGNIKDGVSILGVTGNYQGSGDEITATNNTGAAISTGDKVFLNPPTSSSVMVSGLDTLPHFISNDGSTVYYDNYRYDVATGNATSGSEYPMSNDGGIVNGLRYTSLGMFAGPYQIVGLTLRVLDKIVLSENYGFEYYQGSQLYWNLYELNPSDLSSYTFRHNCIFNYNVDCRQMRLVVIGNKLYASQSNNRWVGEITSGVTNITMNERTDSLYVLYATSDNKCAICCDTAGSYDGTWSGVKLYNVNGSYELNGVKTSANTDFNSLIANNNVIITFNNVTGVLCLSVYGSGDYGCFRYNSATEDFDTVSIALSGQTASGYMMLTVTDDLSKAQYGNYLYTLAGGNYQAVLFANFTQAGYTGIATSNAAIGADVTVKTVLE